VERTSSQRFLAPNLLPLATIRRRRRSEIVQSIMARPNVIVVVVVISVASSPFVSGKVDPQAAADILSKMKDVIDDDLVASVLGSKSTGDKKNPQATADILSKMKDVMGNDLVASMLGSKGTGEDILSKMKDVMGNDLVANMLGSKGTGEDILSKMKDIMGNDLVANMLGSKGTGEDILSKMKDVMGNDLVANMLGSMSTGDKKNPPQATADTLSKMKDVIDADLVADFLTGGKSKGDTRDTMKQQESSEAPNSHVIADFDWKLVDTLKKGLRNNPKPLLGLASTFLKGKGILDDDTMPLANTVMDFLSGNEAMREGAFSLVESLESFFKAESGVRMLRVLPKLLNSDVEEAVRLVDREAEYNQDVFFNLLRNDDLAEQMLRKAANLIVSLFGFASRSLQDDLRLAVMNGMLVSYGLPGYSRRDPIGSFSKFAERLLLLTTTTRPVPDVREFVDGIMSEFGKQYFRPEDLAKLTEEEIVTVIARAMHDNFLEPAKDAWLAYRRAGAGTGDPSSARGGEDDAGRPRCAAAALCIYNLRHFKQARNGLYRSSASVLSSAVESALVTLHEDEEDEDAGDFSDALSAAVSLGRSEAGSEDTCRELGPADGQDCDVFTEYRRRLAMSVSYTHNEL